MITKIPIQGEKKEAEFVERLNRFEALVKYGDETMLCHVANTGRMKELLVPGRRVIIRKAGNPNRKTKWDLLIAHTGEGEAVFLESVMANRLILKALKEGKLFEFEGYEDVKREVSFGNSRFDIGLTGRKGRCYIEVKCVTLVESGLAKFPDAPTERGRKHVKELVRAKISGNRSAIIVVAQRGDAACFTPNRDMDPEFARAVNRGVEAGVEVYAYKCRVTADEIVLSEKIEVKT
jgi:sugar fermentation stimulation protein A